MLFPICKEQMLRLVPRFTKRVASVIIYNSERSVIANFFQLIVPNSEILLLGIKEFTIRKILSFRKKTSVARSTQVQLNYISGQNKIFKIGLFPELNTTIKVILFFLNSW